MTRLLEQLDKWQAQMQRTLFFSSLYETLRKFLPIIIISVLFQLFIDIFLTSNSFFALVFHWELFRIWPPANHLANMTSLFLKHLILPLFAYFFASQLENRRGVHDSLLPLVNFIVIWLLFSNNLFVRYSGQNILLVSLIVFSLTRILNKIAALHQHTLAKYLYSLLFLLVMTAVIFALISVEHLPSNFIVSSSQWLNDTFINQWSGRFIGVFCLTILASILLWLGLPVPAALLKPNFSLLSTAHNLNASLDKSVFNIPNLLSLYTLYDSFAIFGGVSMGLALVIALLIRSHGPIKRLTKIALIPSLLDNNQILNFALPLFFNPLFLLPAILSPIFGITLTAIALKLRWLAPSVYELPRYTPNILTAFLSSNGDWRTIVLVLVILMIGVLTYLPFVDHWLKGAGSEII
ncbi:PTS sugar transporter subunit IIC [Oenococcus sicerae]|uniref:PTS sugar transporter subunit IIC n=1 Tax=Oenococcus sicerae TaxID=2203724 RepID=UPI0039E8E335